MACEYQKLEVVRYLLREDQGTRDLGVRDLGVDAKARAVEKDPKTKRIMGHNKTGLHLAAIHDSPEIAQELIAKGCPLDAKDYKVNLKTIRHHQYLVHDSTAGLYRVTQLCTLPIERPVLMWLTF